MKVPKRSELPDAPPLALSVRVVAVIGVAILAAISVLVIGTFARDLWDGEAIFFGSIKAFVLTVALVFGVAVIVRRVRPSMPVAMTLAPIIGLGAGVAVTSQQLTETAELRRSMAELDCKQVYGDSAIAAQLEPCVPIATRCRQQDAREVGEHKIAVWFGINPCITDGLRAAGLAVPERLQR